MPDELVEVAALVVEGKVEARIVEVVWVATAVVVKSEDRVESELEEPKSSFKSEEKLNRESEPDEDEVVDDEPSSLINRLKALLRISTQPLELREVRPAEAAEEVATGAGVTAVATVAPAVSAPATTD